MTNENRKQRHYTAWTPFWKKIGSKPVTPGIVFKSIGVHLPLFTTKRACKEWIDDNKDTKESFGLFPNRVSVTIEYNTANAEKGTHGRP